MAHKIRQFERTVINQDAEVLEYDKIEVYSNGKFYNEPDYVKLYLADVAKLHRCGKPAQDALACLLQHMNYDNVIHLVKYTRDQICECCGLSDTHLRKVISELKEKEILLPITQRGTYLVNPYLIGKGKWKDIEKLRLTITYSEKGRTFNVDRLSNKSS